MEYKKLRVLVYLPELSIERAFFETLSKKISEFEIKFEKAKLETLKLKFKKLL